MPFYKYTAKEHSGKRISGKVEANTEGQAASLVTQRGHMVIKIQPVGEESFVFFKNKLFGVKQGDVSNFTRQLATMITAGLPLTASLSILEEQSKPALAKIINGLLRDVEGGTTFAKSVEKHPHVFSRLYSQLIKAGEAGGVLDTVLERLADTLEKQKAFQAKVKGALIYPIIVLIGMVAVAMIMLFVVVPQLTGLYEDFGAELPLSTRVLIFLSKLLVNYWWLLLAGLMGLGAFLRGWKKTPAGKKTIDALLFRLPIVGVIRSKIILTEFSRTMSLLLGAGVSLLHSLDIVAGAINSISYRQAIEQASKQVEKGMALSQTIAHHEFFPPILHQMIAVGEETGKLDDLLIKLSGYFEAESERAIQNLTVALEPIIMIVLGVGVGFMVFAIIMPIYNLTAQF